MVTDSEHEALMSLRHKGYAIVVFTPDELNGVEAKRVEDRMIETGVGYDFMVGELK